MQRFDIGEAITWAWDRFSKNAVPLIAATAIFLVPLFGAVWYIMFNPPGLLGIALFPGLVEMGDVVLMAFELFVVATASGFALSALLAGYLDIADGKPVTLQSFFAPRNPGSAVTLGLVLGLAGALDLLLTVTVPFISVILYLPMLAVGVLGNFVYFFIVDRALAPLDAVKASIAVCRSNLAGVLLLYLVAGVVVALGGVLCGIGMLVTAPLGVLINTYGYRRLSGGVVA